jgi:short-subunit dehydrogenase
MDTHYFGTLSMARAFAPVIEANGGGTILNILSVLSWVALPEAGAYSAAKTAEWRRSCPGEWRTCIRSSHRRA